MTRVKDSRIVKASLVRGLRDQVRELKRENEALRAQRRETAQAVRTLLNVAHDDDTDEVPF